MPPKRAYDLAFKKRAVDLAKLKGNRPAATDIGIDEKRIREWRQQLASGKFSDLAAAVGEGTASKRQRLAGGGRKPAHEEMESQLALWIIDQRQQYFRVTRKSICAKATALANEPDFKASRGWVENFMKRHNFVIRAKTTTGQRLPPEMCRKVVDFVRYCTVQRYQKQLSPSHIGNMDETAIWADMPGESTVDTRGVKHVPILTTGHEKSRITVCLAAMADGRKLPPLVVFKGKRMPQELKCVQGVIVELSNNGWMKPETTLSWINKVWGKFSFHDRLLVWDSFRCHLTAEARAALKASKTTIACIPGGCTKLLQPADVSWNKPFKDRYRELYENWLQEEDRITDLTAFGNPRAPTKLQMVNWVKQAWNSLSREVITKSFDACGITTSDPNTINCTKIGGVAESSRDELLMDTPGNLPRVDLDESLGDGESDHDLMDIGDIDDVDEIDIGVHDLVL